jgi:hypothetical protein
LTHLAVSLYLCAHMAEFETKISLSDIEMALRSDKVDPRLGMLYSLFKDGGEDVDISEKEISFLGRVKEGSNPFGEWEICAIEDIRSVLAPFSALPGFVANPDVISIEASLPAGTLE